MSFRCQGCGNAFPDLKKPESEAQYSPERVVVATRPVNGDEIKLGHLHGTQIAREKNLCRTCAIIHLSTH